MSSRSAATQHEAASRNDSATVDVRPAVQQDVVAVDKPPTSDFAIFGDPLWGIAIASLILFAVLAALIALA